MKIIKFSLKIIRIILIVLVFGTLILLAFSLLSGVKLYCVQTGSMEPQLTVGSMVMVEPVEFSQLNKGDVITYVVSGNTVVTHRLVEIDTKNQLLTTKGDNNNIVDQSPVSYGNVIGRVRFHIPYVGYVLTFFSTRFGKIMLGIVAFALLGAWFIRRMYFRNDPSDEDDDSQKKDSSGVEEKNHGNDESETWDGSENRDGTVTDGSAQEGKDTITGKTETGISAQS